MLGDLDEAAAIEEALAAAEAQAQEEQESSSAVQVISEDSNPDVLTQEKIDQLSASDCGSDPATGQARGAGSGRSNK